MKDTETRAEEVGIRDQKVIKALRASAHTQLQSVGKLGSGDEILSDMGYVGKLSFLKERIEGWNMGLWALGFLGAFEKRDYGAKGVVGMGLWDMG